MVVSFGKYIHFRTKQNFPNNNTPHTLQFEQHQELPFITNLFARKILYYNKQGQ